MPTYPTFSSSINTKLPNAPNTDDPELLVQLQLVYNAINALHIELESHKKNLALIRIFVGMPPYP
jgi:hypothetical protein